MAAAEKASRCWIVGAHRTCVLLPNYPTGLCPCCIAIMIDGHLTCAACTALIAPAQCEPDSRVEVIWHRAALHVYVHLPPVIVTFFAWLRDVCRIQASNVDIVTFLQHPATGANAAKLAAQLYRHPNGIMGAPTETVALIIAAIIAPTP